MVASNKAQILQLTPASEIVFEGPFEHVVTSYLELKNPSDQKVCFKVKTTAPRRYCVRPNSGIVEPDGKVKIAIMLQPMEADSQGERTKHKFMVQSYILRDETANLDNIWQNVSPEDVMDSKLRCVFQSRASSSTGITGSNNVIKEQPDTTVFAQIEKELTKSPAPTAATTTTSSQQSDAIGGQAAQVIKDQQQPQQQNTTAEQISQKIGGSFGQQQQRQQSATSTPIASRSSFGRAQKAQCDGRGDESMASRNLTSSFLQPMSDDYRFMLVSLAMLIIGVILGKYII